MAKWQVIETREDLVTVERQGSAGMVSMPPANLGLVTGHQIALGTTVWSEDGQNFSLSEAPAEGDSGGG